MEFEAERALEHVRALSYPRRVGTLGERRAARYVTQQFAGLGLPWKRERFLVSHFPAEIGNRLLFFAAGLLVTTGTWAAASRPLAAALCWGCAAFLVNAPWRLHYFLGKSWPPRSMSRNVLAALPGSPPAPVRIVFMAHYDTKSQLLPTGVRVALVSAVTVLCIGLCFLGLLAALGLHVWLSATGPWRLAALICALLAGLIANVTGNRSPGALDNGAAVGTLLELARTWRPKRYAPIEAYWVATGSEEVALNGARDLLASHASWLREKPTLIINLESVGAGAIVYLAGDSQGIALARQAADELGLPHANLHVLGAGMDHEPFAAEGLAAVSILGDVVHHSLALHSKRDQAGRLEMPALERAGRLSAHLAWRWAEMHQTLVVPLGQPIRQRRTFPAVEPIATTAH
jgi:hypothetical protein